jgi:hypothetical protein
LQQKYSSSGQYQKILYQHSRDDTSQLIDLSKVDLKNKNNFWEHIDALFFQELSMGLLPTATQDEEPVTTPIINLNQPTAGDDLDNPEFGSFASRQPPVLIAELED